MKSLSHIVALATIVLCITLLIGLVFRLVLGYQRVEIRTADIKDLYVRIVSPENDSQIRLPPEAYDSIIDVLQPAVRDKDPAKWQGLVVFRIVEKNGIEQYIDVFDTPYPDVRFSFDDGYFIGGNKSRLLDILEANGVVVASTQSTFHPEPMLGPNDGLVD
jgi:hypothetical protein